MRKFGIMIKCMFLKQHFSPAKSTDKTSTEFQLEKYQVEYHNFMDEVS